MPKKNPETPSEGPFQRLVGTGIRGADPVDLLCIAISEDAATTAQREDVARALLRRYGIHYLGDLGRTDLQELTGLKEFDAVRVLAALEIGRRSGLSAKGQPKIITKPADVAVLFEHLKDERREHFCAVLLGTKGGVIGIRTIHIGTLDSSIVGPREFFREAVREGASSIIAVHNHPSGDPTPSPEDIQMTLKLKTIGEILDIPLRDHVIIGHHEFVSLATRGYL